MSECEGGVVDRGGPSVPRGAESGTEDNGSIPLNIRSPAASFQDIRYLSCVFKTEIVRFQLKY